MSRFNKEPSLVDAIAKYEVCIQGTMSEQVMVMGKVNKGMSKNASVQGYESAWLGRWSHGGDSKELIRPRDKDVEGVEVLPFPLFKVSQKRDNNNNNTTKLQAYHDVGSSSKMLEKERFGSSNGQEKTTQNLLELIRPVRIYATVDSVQRGEMNLPEKDGPRVSMKLKGKFFGGYLDLFPNQDHYQHKGGVTLQSLESSKNTEEDGPRKNESSAKTDTLEMDRPQMIHLSGSSSSSSIKGKGIKGARTEIPDMNEEPPLVLEREDSVDGHRGETSNSATQSMNVDNFVSRECKRVRLESEPSSRWVKRLKRTASDSSGHAETKSLMRTEEASLGRKGSNNKNLFLDTLKSGINNLQPRNQEPDTSQNLNHGGREDITLLHPWIQRWCKKKTTLTDQPEVQDGSFEPENQKETEKKHFPSIAAMALMGKALSGINPYGLRKTDSLMVWNVRDLR